MKSAQSAFGDAIDENLRKITLRDAIEEVCRRIEYGPTLRRRVSTLYEEIQTLDNIPITAASTERHLTVIALEMIESFFEVLHAEGAQMRIAKLRLALMNLDEGIVTDLVAPDISGRNRGKDTISVIQVAKAAVAVGYDILARDRINRQEIYKILDRYPGLKNLVRSNGKRPVDTAKLEETAKGWRDDFNKTKPKSSDLAIRLWKSLQAETAKEAADGCSSVTRAEKYFAMTEKNLRDFNLPSTARYLGIAPVGFLGDHYRLPRR